MGCSLPLLSGLLCRLALRLSPKRAGMGWCTKGARRQSPTYTVPSSLQATGGKGKAGRVLDPSYIY